MVEKRLAEIADAVRAARRNGLSYAKIGRSFGIGVMTAWTMVNDPSWGIPKPRATLRERFYKKAIVRDGCWGWDGCKDGSGYGRIGLVTEKGKRSIQASRASWMIHNGPIPQGIHVLHRCDNPECANPDHLFLGTNLDNIADMVAKGRAPGVSLPGARNPNAKITAAQAAAIRSSAERTKLLMARYGISRSMVKNIRSGKNWPA